MTIATSRTITKVTAFAAAVLLALSVIALAALSESAGAEFGAVTAAASQDGEKHNHRTDKPDNNPNPSEPPCDADHGHPGDNAPQCDDEGHPGNNGEKPDKGDDGPEECDEGEVRDEETGECVEEGDGTEECDEGEVRDEETGECVEEGDGDDGGTERCGPGDGLDLTDSGTIGKELHNNDPTGLSTDPDASGPLSEPVYDETQDTGLEVLTEEVACVANLATL